MLSSNIPSKSHFLLFLLLSLAFAQDPLPANFEGHFDSSEGYPDHSHQADSPSGFEEEGMEEEGGMEEEEEGEMEEEEDILEFSENLGEFIADETFTFKMGPNSEETFLIWPGPGIENVRGMFHCEIDWQKGEDYESGGEVDLTILDGSRVARQYKQQRLGIFKQPYTIKDNKFKFVFRSGPASLEVYFSYECIKSDKSSIGERNESQIARVVKKFERVSSLLLQQEKEMERLMEVGDKHGSHLDSHLQQIWWKALLEGVCLVGSACISLWMLQKQLYHGYQQLV